MTTIRKLDLATSFHVGVLLLTIVLFVSVQNLPLLSTLGFESANMLVAVLGPLLFLTALLNNRSRTQGFNNLMAKESLWLLAHVALALALLGAHGLAAKSCSEGAGLLPFLTVAFPPLLLNVSLGVVTACSIRRVWLKLTIFLAAHAIYATAIALLWWQEPNFRILTHASFLISSDLLTGGVVTAPIVGFRASTLLLALAVVWYGICFLGTSARAMFNRQSPRPALNLMVLSALVGIHVLLHIKSVEALGNDRRALLKDYALLAEQDGLRIFANPIKISQDEAMLMLQEARYYQWQLTKRLGPLKKIPLTIWLHDSDDDKFLYTGAKNVHFALPRHREIHISRVGSPHNVLGHELAHLYVGEYSPSIFGVPTSFAVIPNLALTEGLATALTHELNIENGLTLIEQAQALYQAEIRVDTHQLFSNNPLHFSAVNSRAAYIYSAATILFLLEQWPESERPGLLQKLSATGNLSALFPNRFDYKMALGAFNKKLSDATVPQAILWAHERFPKKSILTADCSEDTRLEWLRERALVNHDAQAIIESVNQLPLTDRRAKLIKAGRQLLTERQYVPALSLFKEVESEITDTAEAAQLRLWMLDARVHLDDYEGASNLIANLSEDNLFDPSKRLLRIAKALLADYTQNGSHRELSKAALKFIFSESRDATLVFAELSHALGKVGHLTTSGHDPVVAIAAYLEARFYLRMEAYIEAQSKMANVVELRASLPDIVQREARFMLGTLQKGLKQYFGALYLYQDLLMEAKSDGERITIHDDIDRLRFAQQSH